MQVTPAEIAEAVADLKRQLNSIANGTPDRIDCNPETVEQGLAKLVLGLIELIRRLLERQAIRRMEGGSLNDEQVENMGVGAHETRAEDPSTGRRIQSHTQRT